MINKLLVHHCILPQKEPELLPSDFMSIATQWCLPPMECYRDRDQEQVSDGHGDHCKEGWGLPLWSSG